MVFTMPYFLLFNALLYIFTYLFSPPPLCHPPFPPIFLCTGCSQRLPPALLVLILGLVCLVGLILIIWSKVNPLRSVLLTVDNVLVSPKLFPRDAVPTLYLIERLNMWFHISKYPEVVPNTATTSVTSKRLNISVSPKLLPTEVVLLAGKGNNINKTQ